MKVLITQSNYIPWKGYFDAIHQADVFVLYDDMQYTKRDWRNRNKIKTPQGPLWLSIPVLVKGKYFQKINETEIADESWSKKHWQSILQNYQKAPFFRLYGPLFESLYQLADHSLLSEVNYHFLRAITGILEIDTRFRWSSEFELRGDKSEKLLNICRDLGATHYLSGPAAKDYLDVELFQQHGISVEWMDYSGYPEYPQLYGAFDHAVSILDLLFNAGPEAPAFMKSFKSSIY